MVKVRTVSRLVAVTARPRKLPWVPTPLVRTPFSAGSDTELLPLPVRFMLATVGVPTWPWDFMDDRSPLCAAVRVAPLSLSMPCSATSCCFPPVPWDVKAMALVPALASAWVA